MRIKTTFKNVTAFILAALFLTMAGCGPDPFYIRVALIEGVPETGEAGTPLTLKGTIRPAFASNKDIVWSVKDTGTTGASISGNILNANAEGTVTITAAIANGMAEGKDYTQDFRIVFSEGSAAGGVAVDGVTLNQSTLTLNIGGTYTLTATISPSNAANKNVTWSSDEMGVATVNSNGVVTAHAAGTVTITVTTADGGFTATCNVTVVQSGAPVLVTGVILDQTTLTMTVGDTETLTATISPSDATNKAVSWSSSDHAVATVSTTGLITTTGAGTATITVTTVDGGFTATCGVTVQAATVPVTGVTLNKNTLTLTVGNNETLIATIAPPDATNKNVTWSSSAPVIATVNSTSGLVTAISTGNAVITVMADGGYQAECTVTVQTAGGPITSPTGIELVSIPAGTFFMGSPESEPNRNTSETQHSVTLTKSFYMSKYQVTQAQYQAVMGAVEDRTTTTYGKGDNYPIYYVNWHDAIVFCNKLSKLENLDPVYSINGSTDPAVWGTIPTFSSNSTWDAAVMDKSKNGYRLPTEAEWEYACRGSYENKATETNTKPFGIGDGTKMISGMANFYARNPYDLNHTPAGEYTDTGGTYLGKTTAVGSYAANNYGLYDMHGNVHEWCWDWYGSNYYSSSPANDPDGPITGFSRVGRGGYWFNSGQDLRSAFRDGYNTYGRGYSSGFRLVRSGE